jgi:hypothetical protein
VTVRIVPALRTADLPTWTPLSPATYETPGWPASVHVVLLVLVKTSDVYWLPAPASPWPSDTFSWLLRQRVPLTAVGVGDVLVVGVAVGLLPGEVAVAGALDDAGALVAEDGAAEDAAAALPEG